MKNEGRIMVGEIKEGVIMSNVDIKENSGNMRQKEQTGKSEKIEVKNIPPHNNMQETKLGRHGEEKVIRITPEMDRKLKRLHDFEVEFEAGGKSVKKTAYDVLDMMGSLEKEGLTQEEEDKKIEEIKALRDRFEQKYYDGSSYGNELQRIFNDVVFQGIDMQKQSDQIITALTEGGQINVKELDEKMGPKTGDNKKDKFDKVIDKVIKQLPLPEGVGVAPIVTVGEDGRVTVTPAPGEGGRGISKTPEAPGTPGDKFQGGGDGGGNKIIEEEEKKKINWYKYGQGFLFLLILYLGVQGWYARMWEQFAERAR